MAVDIKDAVQNENYVSGIKQSSTLISIWLFWEIKLVHQTVNY